MGIKRDVIDGIELWRSRPLKNTALLLGLAAMVAGGMAADSKWGPDQHSDTPIPVSADVNIDTP